MNEEVGGQPIGPDTEDVTKLPDLKPELRGKVFTQWIDAVALEKQKKSGTFRQFEILCDEPHWLGGEDKHPQPLTYLAAAVAF
jgi:hypothetical protein